MERIETVELNLLQHPLRLQKTHNEYIPDIKLTILQNINSENTCLLVDPDGKAIVCEYIDSSLLYLVRTTISYYDIKLASIEYIDSRDATLEGDNTDLKIHKYRIGFIRGYKENQDDRRYVV